MIKQMQQLQGNVYWEFSQQETSLNCAIQNLCPSCYEQVPQEFSTESQNLESPRLVETFRIIYSNPAPP